ncbi:uncharacterized protein LOC107638323 [Arachis ipaensis]|uniref:uncharacterized protein LOC107638323 n=1 Tax=Arachis ipaensis TaxID=130454 RepID=UPI0007AF3CA3|nr:uncharacterized protein LOC107638323 [Arachis ipaensis]
MQALTLSKRLSASKPLFRISPNLITQSSTTSSSSTTSPPPSSPISTTDGGSSCHPLALLSLLRASRSATQSLRTGVSRSDVRDVNLAGGQVRAYEVLKLYRPSYGTGIATFKVQPHGAAGYATATTTGDSIQRLVGVNSKHSMIKLILVSVFQASPSSVVLICLFLGLIAETSGFSGTLFVGIFSLYVNIVITAIFNRIKK